MKSNKLDTFALVKEHSPDLLDQLIEDYDNEKERFHSWFVAHAQEKLLICCPVLSAAQAKQIARECLPE